MEGILLVIYTLIGHFSILLVLADVDFLKLLKSNFLRIKRFSFNFFLKFRISGEYQ